MTPSAEVDDAGFYRRMHLDLLGTVPEPAAVRAFLADKDPDKRQRAVDLALANPRYVTRWTDYWEDVLLRKNAEPRLVDREVFRAWLGERLRANTPWNVLVHDLVTAKGRNRGEASDVNGAVNFLLQFQRNPQDAGGVTARTFLGVQIQCAQCHDHKTEPLKQEEFRAFAASFARARARPDGGQGRNMQFVVDDVAKPFYGNDRSVGIREVADLVPRTLDGVALPTGPERREALAAWLIDPLNPTFAKAVVNRLWGYFLGHGFVEPVDDFRPSNPAVGAEVLDSLTSDFVSHGYDLKHLARTIVGSAAYARSAAKTPAPEGKNPERVWATFTLRPLDPDVIVQVVLDATGVEPVLEGVVGENAERIRANMRRAFDITFEVEEDDQGASYAGTISQALLMQNSKLTAGGTLALPGSRLGQILGLANDSAKLDELYLATLSRFPSDAERAEWLSWVQQRAAADSADPRPGRRPGLGPKGIVSIAETPADRAFEDLFWALLNSSELSFNH